MKKILTTLSLITILSTSISFAAPMHSHPHEKQFYKKPISHHNMYKPSHNHRYRNIYTHHDYVHRNNSNSIGLGILAGAITGGIIGAIID